MGKWNRWNWFSNAHPRPHWVYAVQNITIQKSKRAPLYSLILSCGFYFTQTYFIKTVVGHKLKILYHRQDCDNIIMDYLFSLILIDIIFGHLVNSCFMWMKTVCFFANCLSLICEKLLDIYWMSVLRNNEEIFIMVLHLKVASLWWKIYLLRL